MFKALMEMGVDEDDALAPVGEAMSERVDNNIAPCCYIGRGEQAKTPACGKPEKRKT